MGLFGRRWTLRFWWFRSVQRVWANLGVVFTEGGEGEHHLTQRLIFVETGAARHEMGLDAHLLLVGQVPNVVEAGRAAYMSVVIKRDAHVPVRDPAPR
jgi:hypothetical protein